MLDLLPLELLIFIFQNINYQDIINLTQLNNKKINKASTYIKEVILYNNNINNYDYNLIHSLVAPQIIKIMNHENNYPIIDLIRFKKWKLKEFSINSYHGMNSNILKKFLQEQTNLKYFYFLNDRSLFKDEHLLSINKNIYSLNFTNCDINIVNLNRFTTLKELFLHSPLLAINIEDFYYLKISTLRKLSLVNFLSNHNYDEFFNFIINNQNLTELEISCVTHINFGLQEIIMIKPKLRKLVYSSTILNNIPLLNQAPVLTSISLACTNANDILLFSVIDNCPNLKDIAVNFTKVTDLSIIYAVNRLKQIKNLWIAHSKVTNLSIIQISYFCRFLETLDICNIKTNNHYINKIIDNNNNLKRLLLVNYNIHEYPQLRRRDNLLII